ncbi:unknown [Clostridium sp. CAG:632]|nr:unknown [Clostridium sp. CAG:632]
MFTGLFYQRTHGCTDGKRIRNTDKVVRHTASDFILIVRKQLPNILLGIFIQQLDDFLFLLIRKIIQNVQSIIRIHVGNDLGSTLYRQFLQIDLDIIQVGEDFCHPLDTKNPVKVLALVLCKPGDRLCNITLMIIGQSFQQTGIVFCSVDDFDQFICIIGSGCDFFFHFCLLISGTFRCDAGA